MDYSGIQNTIHHYYWDRDLNCATTTLLILSEVFSVTLDQQVLDSAVGMHGAGRYGAQCGLVEGTLLFIGILGRIRKIPDIQIADHCRDFADNFEKEFSSLLCSRLRPGGFRPEDEEHICENLTVRAVSFAVSFLRSRT